MGIDFEPNAKSQLLRNCVIRDCLIEGNAGNGIEFFLIFIPQDLSVPRTMLCGGGGGERINADLFDPSGKMVESWKSLGDWGVRDLDASGIWRLKLSRPTRGTYEDAHINSTGKTPALFFLSPEKYFFQQGL